MLFNCRLAKVGAINLVLGLLILLANYLTNRNLRDYCPRVFCLQCIAMCPIYELEEMVKEK